MRLGMFLSVFLKISIQIDRELEGKLMLVLHHLPLLLVIVSPIDIDEQVLRFISDESRLLVHTAIDLDLKIELFI